MRIIPVEYSEVITIAPRTAMISCPISKNTPSVTWVESNPALLPGLLAKLAAEPAVIATARPTETKNSAPSVQ